MPRDAFLALVAGDSSRQKILNVEACAVQCASDAGFDVVMGRKLVSLFTRRGAATTEMRGTKWICDIPMLLPQI